MSKKRGQPSTRRLADARRTRAVAIVRQQYCDFGPTRAREKLAEMHAIEVSVETLRQWMIGDGVWLPRNRRPPRAHQPRARRPCLGELVQIDGCNRECRSGAAGSTVALTIYRQSHVSPFEAGHVAQARGTARGRDPVGRRGGRSANAATRGVQESSARTSAEGGANDRPKDS